MSKTVMFVHGAWLTPAAWDPFRSRYESQGYTCLTPAWPLEDRPIAALRRSPHPNLGRLTIGKIVDHHENLISLGGTPESVKYGRRAASA